MKSRKRTGNSRSFSDLYSSGCRSCQNGTWLCIFLTYLCNAGCRFCPSPWKNVDRIVSAFGDEPSIILDRIRNTDIRGISFSGGDCFLVFDRLVRWLTYFKERRPEIYYWAYTNGLSADKEKLKMLARLGLNEIRYNIAATDYDASSILQQIQTATRIFEYVAVEIPSIPSDYAKLVDVLPFLDRIGVAYLNLHQHILMKDSTRNSPQFLLNKQVSIRYDADSLRNTQRIKRFCTRNGLNMRINSCTMEKKENQMLHRRSAMGRLFRHKYDRLTSDGLFQTTLSAELNLSIGEIKEVLETDHGFTSMEQYFLHPDEARRKECLELFFMPPMSYDGKRVLIDVKESTHA